MEETKKVEQVRDEVLDALRYMEKAAREVMAEIRRHVEAMAKLETLVAYFTAMLRVAIEQREVVRALAKQREAEGKAAEDS